jgi:hypothetical protein
VRGIGGNAQRLPAELRFDRHSLRVVHGTNLSHLRKRIHIDHHDRLPGGLRRDVDSRAVRADGDAEWVADDIDRGQHLGADAGHFDLSLAPIQAETRP